MYEVVMFRTVPYDATEVRLRKSTIDDAYREVREYLVGKSNRAAIVYRLEKLRFSRMKRRLVGKFRDISEIPG